MEYKKVMVVFKSGLSPEKIQKMENYWENQKGAMAFICAKCSDIAVKMAFVKAVNNDEHYIIPICNRCFDFDEPFEVLEIDLVKIKR